MERKQDENEKKDLDGLSNEKLAMMFAPVQKREFDPIAYHNNGSPYGIIAGVLIVGLLFWFLFFR